NNYLEVLARNRLLDMARKDDEALKGFDQVLKMAPKQPEPWLALVQFHVTRGNHQTAQQVLEEAEKNLPEETRFLALAFGYEMFRRYRKAEAFYQEALKREPNSAVVVRAVAAFLLKQNRMDEATPLLKRLHEGTGLQKLDPQDVLWAKRGLAVVLATSA